MELKSSKSDLDLLLLLLDCLFGKQFTNYIKKNRAEST